jgi:hypothetical protein
MHDIAHSSSLVRLSLVALVTAACGNDAPTSGNQGDAAVVDAATPDGLGFPDISNRDGVEPDFSLGDLAVNPEIFESNEDEETCRSYCRNRDDCGLAGPGCMGECARALTEEERFGAELICVDSASCSEMRTCFGEIPHDDDCDDFCEIIAECNAYDLFDMEPTIDGCVVICDGFFFVADPFQQEIADCIVDTLEDECNVIAMRTECLESGESGCENVCDAVAECPDDSPLGETFAEEGSCESHCDALEGGQEIAFQICVDIAYCDAAHCDDIPEEPSEACNDACELAVDLCGTGDEPGAGSICPWLCEAFDNAVPYAHAEGAADCLEGFDECPDVPFGDEGGDEGGPIYAAALVVCMAQTEQCREICAALTPCIDEVAPLGCAFECTARWGEHPDFLDGVVECIEEGDNCRDTVACIPVGEEQVADSQCQRVCDRFDAGHDCAESEYDGCFRDCFGTFDEHGPTAIAHAMCGQVAACGSVRGCFEAEIDNLEVCVGACGDLEGDACSFWDGAFLYYPADTACVRTCSGLAHGIGEGFAVTSCVASFDDTCRADFDHCR